MAPPKDAFYWFDLGADHFNAPKENFWAPFSQVQKNQYVCVCVCVEGCVRVYMCTSSPPIGQRRSHLLRQWWVGVLPPTG
jgi:hypothetical protein